MEIERRGIGSHDKGLLNLQSSHFSATSYFCKGVILRKELPLCSHDATPRPKHYSIFHYDMAMWPRVKLRVLLGPFTLQDESRYGVIQERRSQATAYPAVAEKEGTADFRGCVTLLYWLIVCRALLDVPIGHLRATSNKAKLAFSNRNSGMMQDLGEHMCSMPEFLRSPG
jgi:hypothetical protein